MYALIGPKFREKLIVTIGSRNSPPFTKSIIIASVLAPSSRTSVYGNFNCDFSAVHTKKRKHMLFKAKGDVLTAEWSAVAAILGSTGLSGLVQIVHNPLIRIVS